MADHFTYFDYAATAPLCPEAAEALRPYLVPGMSDAFIDANANTLYSVGRKAFAALQEARERVAKAIGGRPDEVVFTSCASEADNAAVLGIARAAAAAKHLNGKEKTPRVIISAIEHDAVLLPARRLEQEGFAVTYLGTDKNGHVSPEALEEALTEDCVLVSVQVANGEIGTVQPVAALAAAAHKSGAYFHTDATQGLGKTPFNAREYDVDSASFSAHKVGGPKGVGVLYLKTRTPFETQLLGGGQESGRRSGTQNVAGAVAAAAAMEAASVMEEAESLRLRAFRDLLYRRLCAYPGVHSTVTVPEGSTDFLPNVVNLHIDGFEGPTLVMRFNNAGFCVSGGSACSSGSLEPSRVLSRLGLKKDDALGELRISMGRFTTEEEVLSLIEAFPSVIGA